LCEGDFWERSVRETMDLVYRDRSVRESGQKERERERERERRWSDRETTGYESCSLEVPAPWVGVPAGLLRIV